MDTFVVLQQMLILLAMMAIGYYSYRKEWIDRNAYGKLSKIVVNILNPLIIINGVLGRSGGENGEKVFINLLLILLYFIILIAVSFLVVRLLRVKPSQNHLYRMMTVFSNVGFMAIPLVSSVYGEECVFYVSFYILIYNILLYTYGIHLISGGKKEKTDFKKLMNPGVAACLVSVVVFAGNIPAAESVKSFTGYMGNAAIPMSMSLILTVLGYAFCGDMMRLIHTPDNIFADGELYLKIYVYGLTFLFLYNVCTGIFTALGDSRTPLYFLIGSSLGNIALDYWFVAWLGLGVAGVAWATFIAQGVSAILALGTLARRLGALKTDRRTVLFSAVLLGQIAAIAVPSIMQQSVLSVGNMFVQEIVNRYGSAVIAGYSGAVKLNTFAINAFMSLGGCLSSYTAQNLGAGKRERIPLGFKTGVRLSFYATIPFFLLYFVFSRQMMGLFLGAGSTRAIESGMEFLRIVSPMYFMISIKLMTDGIIRGSGAMTYFVLATVPDLILRIIVANILTGRFGSTGIWMAWPFGWIAATLLTVIFYRRIVSGKFRIRI